MKKLIITAASIAALALAGCGSTAAVTATHSTTPPPAAAAPASTPATTQAPAAQTVPVLHTGKTVTVQMSEGQGADGQTLTVTEKWTLNSAAPGPDGYLLLNVTIVNEGPRPVQGSNAILGYTDWQFVSTSHQVTTVTPTDMLGSGVQQISEVSALGVGQSATGEFGLKPPANTAGTYVVRQSNGFGSASPQVMVIDPQHLIAADTAPAS